MYVLDTNILSELRRARPHGAVKAWFATVPSRSIYIPAIVAGEIQIGIERTAVTNPEKAEEISRWLGQILLSSQCISAGAEIFRIWARLVHRAGPELLVDALVAATAIDRDMIVVTRNVKDFDSFGVRVFNPFNYDL